MNTLELKGGITEMIAGVKNPALLKHLYETVAQIITDAAAEVEVKLTPEQEAQIDLDIDATYIDDNLVDHAEVVENMKRWLN